VIAELVGDVLHGWDIDTTLFLIENYQWSNTSIDTDTSSGMLSVYGICQSDLNRIVMLENESLKISPNPVYDNLNLTVTCAGSGEYQINIIDINGNIVWNNNWKSELVRAEVKDFQIDFSTLQQGIYFAEFKTPYNIFREKIILVK
jgi:hypothetical protein